MARKEQQELSQEAVDRITRAVRSLVEDRVERGVDLNRPMHCDSCDEEKPSGGATRYGAYQLCNDCLLDFTLALSSGQVDTVADYMTRTSEVTESAPPPNLSSTRDRQSIALNPLQARDKLRPSNEPC